MTAILAGEGIALVAFLYFDIFALALWACLFHWRVFGALIAFYVVTKLTVHRGVVC